LTLAKSNTHCAEIAQTQKVFVDLDVVIVIQAVTEPCLVSLLARRICKIDKAIAVVV
jgi:hypothetical protein